MNRSQPLFHINTCAHLKRIMSVRQVAKTICALFMADPDRKWGFLPLSCTAKGKERRSFFLSYSRDGLFWLRVQCVHYALNGGPHLSKPSQYRECQERKCERVRYVDHFIYECRAFDRKENVCFAIAFDVYVQPTKKSACRAADKR